MPPRPLLAETVDPHQLGLLRYPLCGSYKYDGIRGLITSEGIWSRSGRLLPNRALQTFVQRNADFLSGLDVEVLVRDDSDNYLPFYDKPATPTSARIRGVQSHVMAESGHPDFELWAIDIYNLELPFIARHDDLKRRVRIFNSPFLRLVEQVAVQSERDVEDFATRAAEHGMPVAALARILGHGDLRSVTKYVHVRQEAQDRAMEDFDEAQNISGQKRSSGFRPVDSGERRDIAGSSGMLRGRCKR